jgi:hypothetical protein
MNYDIMTNTQKREEAVSPVGYINWWTLDNLFGLQQRDPTVPSETKTRNARATGFQTLLVLTESRFFSLYFSLPQIIKIKSAFNKSIKATGDSPCHFAELIAPCLISAFDEREGRKM